MSDITRRLSAMSVDGVGELKEQMDHMEIVEEEDDDGVPPPHIAYKRYWYNYNTLDEDEIQQLEQGIRTALEKVLALYSLGRFMAEEDKWALFFKNLCEWDHEYTLGFRFYICHLMDKQFSDSDYEFKTRTSFDAHEMAIIIANHRVENGGVRGKCALSWIAWIFHLAETPAPFGEDFRLSTILGEL